MMRSIAAAALFLAACASTPTQAQEACPPAGYDRAALDALKGASFEIADARARREFATAITACLASPDPALRDGIAFEALTTLLRGRHLDVATQTDLTNILLARMAGDDANGFERSFAALAMAEVVRAERLNGHFTDDMRDDVVDRSVAYFEGVTDYRGFTDGEGWRHGVAHGADLLMQISLGPGYNNAQLLRVRDAVAAQVAPSSHAYIHGESERLMRPILFLARREIATEAEWTAWFAQLADPAPMENWNAAFQSEAGLARLHNLKAFANVVYLNARLSENAADDVLLPGAEALLRALP